MNMSLGSLVVPLSCEQLMRGNCVPHLFLCRLMVVLEQCNMIVNTKQGHFDTEAFGTKEPALKDLKWEIIEACLRYHFRS